LICPECGEEIPELVETLRKTSVYDCRGDGCGYRFDLATGTYKTLVEGAADAPVVIDAPVETLG
jgi:hypothetical protein